MDFAALSGPLPKAGVIVAAACVALALLSPRRAGQAAGVAGGLILALVLLLAEIWHSPQLGLVHRHPLAAAAIGAGPLAVVVLLAVAIALRPHLLAVLVVVTLPFRIPIEAGGTTTNLLVPLYLVVGAGCLAFIGLALRGRTSATWGFDGKGVRAPWLERLLALYVGLYAVQAIYSGDFEKALQQMIFFYVPFALMFCVLRRLRWDVRLLRTCLFVAVGLAIAFAAVGFAEYASKTVFLNPKLIAANDVHAYFTVNSVFFDPDIFGRFLALVMILVAATLLYGRERRAQLAALAVLAVLWGGLVLTLSRSSMGALLVGLAILAMSRWDARRTLAAVAAVIVLGVVAVAGGPKTVRPHPGFNGAASGRAGPGRRRAHLVW